MTQHTRQFGTSQPDDVVAAIERFAASLSSSNPFVVGVADASLAVAISDPTLRDNPIIYVNAAFQTLTGYAAAEVVGRNCRFLQGPQTDNDAITRVRTAIADRQLIELDLFNYRKDGSPFWNRLRINPVFGPDGALRYFFASQLDVTLERERVAALEAEQLGLVTENQRVRREMLDAQARLDLALQAGQLGTWNYDPATGQLDVSAGLKRIFGAAPHDSLTYDEFLASVHADDRPRVIQAVAETVEIGTPYEIEYRIVTKAGDRRWIAVYGARLTRRDGSPLSMAGFVTDISARKDAEEHRALLAGELTHRVKNTLATVGAVVNQSLRTATSLKDARDAIGGRIASLATAHDLLISDKTAGASIDDIVRGALRAFDDGTGALFTIDGPELRLDPNVTLALSMALHELATNAVKYGALSQPGGRVAIRWSIRGGDADSRDFEFPWQESGGPAVAPPTRVGFGSRMIDRLMAKPMRGEAKTTYLPAGVQFRLTAKL